MFRKREVEPDDRRGVIVVSALSIISARKVDFASGVIREFRSDVHSVECSDLNPGEVGKVLEKVVEIIADLDWRLFVTEEEVSRKHLNPDTRLEDLNRERIWTRVRKSLSNFEVLDTKVRAPASH